MPENNIQHKRFIARKYYSRLDHFLVEFIPDMSRSQIVRLINDNRVTLNDKLVTKKNHEILTDDVIEIEIEEIEPEVYTPSLELRKLFEDEYLLIIDKPEGISVHPAPGEHNETILDVFRYNYPQINEIPKMDNDDRPGIVHRLDKDTSGVMILAKDVVTMRRLQKQFKKREVQKTYLAFAAGQLRYLNGTIDAPIARNPRNRIRKKVSTDPIKENARDAVTEYSLIHQYPDFCYVKILPHTGRTHQIRVHFAHLGNPILGDTLYGKNHPFERLALHAYSIEFCHPITGNIIKSYARLPEVLRNYLRGLKVLKK